MRVLKSSLKATLGTVEGYTDEVESLLKNATYGLSALETLVDDVEDNQAAMRGGAETLESLAERLDTHLDFARIQTIASPVTLTGSAQYVYSRSGSARPFFFGGGTMSWNAGAWAGGEDVTITVQLTTDGSNWETMWSLNLTAAASPLTVAIPSGYSEDSTLNIPMGFWVGSNCGVRVGIVQDVEGAGYHAVSHNFVDGVPGG
jgi:hypothetical protein